MLLISENSHGNPWGGTVVSRDSHGEVRAFFGHVCGRARFGTESASVADVYRKFDVQDGFKPAPLSP